MGLGAGEGRSGEDAASIGEVLKVWLGRGEPYTEGSGEGEWPARADLRKCR